MSHLLKTDRPVALILLIMLALSMIIPYRSVQAATFTVSTCNSAELIAAINAANATAENDLIELNGGCSYVLTAIDNSTNGANGLPVIPNATTAGTLTINGNGATIQRDGAAPAFRIVHVQSGGNLTLNDLILRGGRATGTVPASFGGAVFNWDGTLTILDSTLSDNMADFGGALFSGYYATANEGVVTISSSTISDNAASNSGGGISNNDTLTITNSSLSGNTVTSWGGAVRNNGTLTILDSTVSDNSAVYGGGVYNGEAGSIPGTVTLIGSTVSGNWGAFGGGVFNRGGMAVITNNTFSGNRGIYGGGLYNSDGLSNNGTMTVTNSTLSGNSATYGGGVNNEDSVTFSNSIIARGPLGVNCLGTVTDGGYNIADDGTCGFANTDSVGVGDNVDPMLKVFWDYGGPTWTHAVYRASPAVSVVPPVACVWDHDSNDGTPKVPLTTDQRGVLRNDGFCDIGAFEIPLPDQFINEREFFAQMQLEIASNPASQILDFAVIDLVPGMAHLTLRTSDGTVGQVEVSITDNDLGFVMIRIVSITVDGEEPPEDYVQTVNWELPPLITSSLQTLSDQKIGPGRNLENLWMTDTAFAAIFLAP